MKHGISLLTAILININIVVGSAFFLSAANLSSQSGWLAIFAWVVVGLLLFPLVFVLGELAKKYPVAGGIYVFAQKEIGEFWGFISGWSYFIGTAAGNALVLYAFRRLLHTIGLNPLWGNSFGSDIIFVSIFSLLCLLNIKFMDTFQALFTLLKSIPFILTAIACIFAFKLENFVLLSPISLSSFITPIPLVLFAYVGMEATCSIAHLIENGKRNAQRAMLISFGLVLATYTITQAFLLGIHGPLVTDPFAGLMAKISTSPTVIFFGTTLIQVSILSSFLAGFYSMFFANNWTLHAMASEGQIVFSRFFTTKNKYGSPLFCILFQGLLIIGFLGLTNNIETLMTMSDFGIVIAYLLSTASYAAALRKQTKSRTVIALSATIGSLLLLTVCFKNLVDVGYSKSLPFIFILCAGLLIYKKSRKQ